MRLAVCLVSCVVAACSPPFIAVPDDAGDATSADGGDPLDAGGVADANDVADAGDVADANEAVDAGGAPDAGEVVDAGDLSDAGEDVDAGDLADAGDSTDAGTPIDATARTWTYVPVDGAVCGNGTDTGLGVNLNPGASTLVVYLAGGGACWEVGACYVLRTAVHVEDTVQSAVVLAEAQGAGLGVLFDRTDATNPLKDAHFAYVPYCTADFHGGTHVQRYEALGQTRDLHHVGALNFQRFLDRLAPTARGVTRVVLAGASAGGYGALLNAWRVRRAFGPDVRLDVVSDSGIPVAMAWDRFGTAMATWQTAWPPDCADCATTGFPALLPSYAAIEPAPARFGLLAYRRDNTIATYFGISGDDVLAGLGTIKSAATANQRVYLLDGTSHVVLTTPAARTSDGVVALDWLRSLVTDDAGWAHAGP